MALSPLYAAPASKKKKPAAQATRSGQRNKKPQRAHVLQPVQQVPLIPAKKDLRMVGVEDHPEASPASVASEEDAFSTLMARLNEQVKANTYDFCPALSVILEATHDEFAAPAWMQRAAKAGNAAAMQYVANRTLRQVPKDQVMAPEIKEAYAQVLRAADMGFDPAKLNAYMCMSLGLGVKQDVAAAKKYMMEACKSGSFIPRFKWLETSGRLEEFDDKDRPEVKSEIDRGNYHVIYTLALKAPDTAQQVEWLKKAAEQGSPEATLVLSSLCAKTHPKESYALLQESVKLHAPEAMFTMGSTIINPDPDNPILREAGIVKNEQMGMHLLKLASMIGDVASHFWLGNAYYDGKYGLPKDMKRAYLHFQEGAMAGNLPCLAATGYLQARGMGTEASPEQGVQMLQRAAHVGFPYAVILLARLQYEGIGMPANASEAAIKLQEAAVMRRPDAYVCLAWITARGGNNMKADEAMAQRYLNYARQDMGEAAQKMYDEMTAAGKWEPRP